MAVRAKHNFDSRTVRWQRLRRDENAKKRQSRVWAKVTGPLFRGAFKTMYPCSKVSPVTEISSIHLASCSASFIQRLNEIQTFSHPWLPSSFKIHHNFDVSTKFDKLTNRYFIRISSLVLTLPTEAKIDNSHAIFGNSERHLTQCDLERVCPVVCQQFTRACER